MLEKLAKQSAIYGVSTIIGRLLSYLLTPYYTRIFAQSEFGVITDIYALIPFMLVLLTMGMESSYFRFAAKAEAEGGGAEAVAVSKRQLFATSWGITSLAAVVFFGAVCLFDAPLSRVMGEAYVVNPLYLILVAAIVMFDVVATIPFARLREQGRAKSYVSIKLLNIVLQVSFAFAMGFMGLFDSDFGVGWCLVANLAASVITFGVILSTTSRVVPRINFVLLGALLVYSMPLLLSGVTATATDFIDRQMIKYLIPDGAMAQLGIYGAVVKIAVVMTLFTQMYRLAAEPFFLSNFKKEDFVEMNAAAMKYFVMASMMIFLGIALFKDLFALIVGRDFREGIYILPIVLGANVLMGVWLNLSFWYKREERTSLALVITLAGLASTVVFNLIFVPRWGYYGAAWARFVGEAVMVVVSYSLNRRLFPTPYPLRRIGEYVGLALALYALSVWMDPHVGGVWLYVINALILSLYVFYAVVREKIDVVGLVCSMLKLKRG
ncbi:MAG: polysaccharide biosynthesis C-terminal domain-containing protein [Rikenellaceae bacterium]